MAKSKLSDFDAAEYLDDPEVRLAFVRSALATGDAAYIMKALGEVARAVGMAKIADETGRGRTSP